MMEMDRGFRSHWAGFLQGEVAWPKQSLGWDTGSRSVLPGHSMGWPWWVGPIGHTSALLSVGGQSGWPSLPVRVIVESFDAVALKGPSSFDTRSCAAVSHNFWGSCPRRTGGSLAAS